VAPQSPHCRIAAQEALGHEIRQQSKRYNFTELFGAGLLNPTKCVTFLSFDSRMNPDFILTCMATGALGYVVKGRLVTDLEPAIREAVAGRIFISPALKSES
jgi:DNA-binding NarL/FixJ family response regulator